MTISRLNWGQINETPQWSPVTGKLYALWPLPLDHDQCFQAAGVTDFEDSDDAWHDEFEALVQRLLDALGGAESATLKEGEYPFDGWRERRSVREALVAATYDDNFPPCVVQFGEPATALLRTSDGHAILWIWIAKGEIGGILASVAQGRELQQIELKWEILA